MDWQHLKHLALMKTPEDIKAFEQQVWALAESKDGEHSKVGGHVDFIGFPDIYRWGKDQNS